MDIEIREAQGDYKYNTLIIIHNNCIGRLTSGLVNSGEKQGYWVRWNNTQVDSTFYYKQDIEICPLIEIYINGDLLKDEALDFFFKQLINCGVTLNRITLQLDWSFLLPDEYIHLYDITNFLKAKNHAQNDTSKTNWNFESPLDMCPECGSNLKIHGQLCDECKK